MKKISKTVIIASALVISGGLIAGLAAAASYPSHRGFSHYGHHGKIKALKLDTNKDGALSQEELLSHSIRRFTRLDSDENGNISQEEFNARLMAMFETLDRDGDGLLSAYEMSGQLHGGIGHHKHISKYG